jgi:uncharacterized protein
VTSPPREEWTSVPTAMGDLRALTWIPDAPTPLPGIVLVDGSGDGACDDWGGWPERFAACGAVVLSHDKPGSGGSPGNWLEQTFEDRARESLAALAVLRAHPACAGQPVGLLGFSQGGWVALLAAAAGGVDFLISLSGPGVSPAAQDRDRIERELRARGTDPGAIAEAMAWIDERTKRLLGGEPVEDVLADQERLADRSWYAGTTEYFDNLPALSFLGRLLDFDPMPVLRRVPCPVLALFGAADTLVPVAASVEAFAANLPALPGEPHGLAVFPGADHGLFTADPDPAVPRTEQLAPGFLPMVAGFLTAQTS